MGIWSARLASFPTRGQLPLDRAGYRVRVHVPIRDLAERHGIRPSKALGQNFLLDPNLALAIARDADVGPGTRVVEVGAGLGSLTVALAEAGASEVLAIEFDRALMPALAEVVAGHPSVRVLHADAAHLEWAAILPGEGWVLVANLPYNVGTTITVDVTVASAASAAFGVSGISVISGYRIMDAPGWSLPSRFASTYGTRQTIPGSTGGSIAGLGPLKREVVATRGAPPLRPIAGHPADSR